jgi:hypothetical protein
MVKHLELSNGGIAVIDAEDASLVAGHSWFALGLKTRRYAATWVDGKQTLLHRHLLKPRGKELVDHINGDGLDNRRSNLRIADRQGNSANSKKSSAKTSSRFKGVSFVPNLWKWRARIRVDGRLYHLGVFRSERRAAITYNRIARRAFGAFALLNDLGSPRA